MTHQISNELRARARSFGFDQLGIIPAKPGKTLDAYLQWIERGFHGGMGYLARPDRLARRKDLNVVLPGIQSIICVSMNQFPGRLPEDIARDPSRGRISNYAWQADYHDVMTPRLKALGQWLENRVGGSVRNSVYVDTGALMERDHAAQANLGFIGKNSMLISPRRGSWRFLGELLTTVPLPYDSKPAPMPSCGSCSRCLHACPTDAFAAPYVLDARRCISYLTIELKGWIPKTMRSLMGNWIFGCDVCQEVCPFNRFAEATGETAFLAPMLDAAAPPLLDLLAISEAQFIAQFADSPIKRIKRRGLVRNACVAAGNWGSPKAISPLVRLLDDPEPLLRGHAAWALRQIGGDAAHAAVSAAYGRETDDETRLEMGG